MSFNNNNNHHHHHHHHHHQHQQQKIHARHSSDHGSHHHHGLPSSQPTTVPPSYCEMEPDSVRSSSILNRTSHSSPATSSSSAIYFVYQLPYNVRKSICDLLDADQSWRELGGRYMGFNDTQLALISHALYRGASPTNELLTKWEASNAKVGHLFLYLWQMKHRRAIDYLWPYLTDDLRESYAGHIDSNMNFPIPPGPPMMMMSSMVPPSVPPAPVSPSVPPPPSPVRHHSGKILPESRPPVSNPEEETQSTSTLVDIRQNQAEPRTNFRKSEDPSDYLLKIDDFKISYKELVIATDDFSRDNILGSGGFGTVYVGDWKGTKVAVKKLKGLDNLTQALTELRILNCCRIDNILPLYAVSLDGPEPCLVYQYMSNGSLEDRLLCKNQTQPLTWLQRLRIGEGIARALNFLHTIKGNPFVHGDVKSANILLDPMFEPKLGDFGLARQVVKNNRNENSIYTHCTVTSVNGTSVYLPAEYLRQKILSPAVDVYSYGIVILEMATGRRAYDGKRLLINSVEDEYTKAVVAYTTETTGGGSSGSTTTTNATTTGTPLESLMDKRIAHLTEGRHSFNYLLELGRRCAHKTKFKRPIMVQILEYFNQCRATDRIHKLCDKVKQNRTTISRGNFKNPKELQLWYDFVRKSCGTLSEIVFENFGAQVTKIIEDIGGHSSESTFCLELLLNSRSSSSNHQNHPISNSKLSSSSISVQVSGSSTSSNTSSQITRTNDEDLNNSSSIPISTTDSDANLSQYLQMINIGENSETEIKSFNNKSNESKKDQLEDLSSSSNNTTTPFIPLLTALGFEPSEIDQLIG